MTRKEAQRINAQKSTFPEWQHKFTAAKPYIGNEYGGSRVISVEAGLHYLSGNTRPYFSVTGEIGRPKARDCDACGMLHEPIAIYWPELRPVIALHLSDDNGEPMHAAANGLYWLGFGQYSKLDYQTAANHFRITVPEAVALQERIVSGSGYDPAKYEQELSTMRPRWKAEADAAIALLQSLAN